MLQPDHAPVLARAQEARALAEQLQQRLAELEVEARALLTRVVAGEASLLPRYLQLQESVLRLTYAPTLHMLHGMDPTDPEVERTLRTIDETIDGCLEQLRASLQPR